MKRLAIIDIDSTLNDYGAQLNKIFNSSHLTGVSANNKDRYPNTPYPIIEFAVDWLNKNGEFNSIKDAFDTLHTLQYTYDIIFLSACGSGKEQRKNRLKFLQSNIFGNFTYEFINVDSDTDKKYEVNRIVNSDKYENILIVDDRKEFLDYCDRYLTTMCVQINSGEFPVDEDAMTWKEIKETYGRPT